MKKKVLGLLLAATLLMTPTTSLFAALGSITGQNNQLQYKQDTNNQGTNPIQSVEVDPEDERKATYTVTITEGNEALVGTDVSLQITMDPESQEFQLGGDPEDENVKEVQEALVAFNKGEMTLRELEAVLEENPNVTISPEAQALLDNEMEQDNYTMTPFFELDVVGDNADAVKEDLVGTWIPLPMEIGAEANGEVANVKVLHLAQDGTLEVWDTKKEGDTWYVQIGTLSPIAIVYQILPEGSQETVEETAEATTEATATEAVTEAVEDVVSPEVQHESSSSMSWIWIVVVFVVVVAGYFGLKKKK